MRWLRAFLQPMTRRILMPDTFLAPSIHDQDAFRQALAPHQRRLRLARTFLDMDVTWAGQEAYAFRQLLMVMTDYLDNEAISRLAEAKTRIDRAMGEPERDHKAEIQRRNGDGFRGALRNVMAILEEGSWPGHHSLFKRPGVPALANIVDDLARRCLEVAPKRIAEMEELADHLERLAGNEPRSQSFLT